MARGAQTSAEQPLPRPHCGSLQRLAASSAIGGGPRHRQSDMPHQGGCGAATPVGLGVQCSGLTAQLGLVDRALHHLVKGHQQADGQQCGEYGGPHSGAQGGGLG